MGLVLYAYAYHDQRMTLTLMRVLCLLMSSLGLGTIWLLDAIHWHLAITRLRAGDDVKAKRYLGRVLMLHANELAAYVPPHPRHQSNPARGREDFGKRMQESIRKGKAVRNR